MKSLQKIKRLNKKIVRPEHFLYLVVAAFILIFVWWLAAVNHVGSHKESGNSRLVSTARQQFYKSLDLSQVRQADFTSEAVKKEKNLGTKNGVQHIIFSFGVPHDNLTEHGLLTLPQAGPPSGGYPVLILLHGYVNPIYYSTQRAYLTDMDFYSRHGYAVLKPDLRGQGLSLASGQPEGAYYSMAYNTDTLSLIAAVKKTTYLNSKKISLWGHSLGAYVALRAAVVSRDIKDVILLSGPVGYPQDMYTSYVASSDVNNSTAANIKFDALDKYGTPLSNPAFWNKASPLSYLKDTDAFFQINVGTADSVVPPRFSADLDQALTKAGKSHEYYIYPGGGHGLGPERSLIWQRSLATLDKS